MIKIEAVDIVGFEHALRGMRNPKNSWEKSDSTWDDGYRCSEEKGYTSVEVGFDDYEYWVGPNDKQLMLSLAKSGPVHAKYRRFIDVYLDITAPLYWWKEFDTYRVGVADNPTDIEMNSCSTMHKLTDKEFVVADFSCEHLIRNWNGDNRESVAYVEHPLSAVLHTEFEHNEKIPFMPIEILRATINALNTNREAYLKTNDKKYWWQIIQLLPSSYNQKRTIKLNYEVLANIYSMRKDHKLDEWRDFCEWVEGLPCSQIITLKE